MPIPSRGYLACFAIAMIATMPSAAFSATEKTLYSFGPEPDGSMPFNGLSRVGDKFYGTTTTGGYQESGCSSAGCGTVYSITKHGAESVLYKFRGGTDGWGPEGRLVEIGGVFYGVTSGGGSSGCTFGEVSGCGTVFSITLDGVEKVLYTFKGGADGIGPIGGLLNFKGTLYGTTTTGGAYNAGTVFSVSTGGTEKVIYSFKGGHQDGASPEATLTSVGKRLYGTTALGGRNGCYSGSCGIVFSISPSGREKVLYRFARSDGFEPNNELLNVSGTLYGTTRAGGSNDAGTIFSITTSGAEKTLYSFTGLADGASPKGPLINVGGLLYGETPISNGGTDGGTIFSLTTAGVVSTVYSFLSGGNNAGPGGGLSELGGSLYGTTEFGGTASMGTFFRLTP